MAEMTKQQLFSTALLAFINESEGGYLKEFCEVLTQDGGETATFNRLKEATGVDGVESMFDSNTVDDGGDMAEFKATIGFVSAKQKIKKEDMNKTKIDIKNSYVQSLGRAVDRKVDMKILDAIKLKDADLAEVGSVVETVEAQAKLIIGAVIGARSAAEITPDGKQGVALVMNKKDWTGLSTSDYVLNSDYAKAFGGSEVGIGSTFFGAKVIFLPSVESGTMYVVPSNAVGFAEWEGQNSAVAPYYETDGMRYHCQAVKSGGAICIEPEVITKVTSKPIA